MTLMPLLLLVGSAPLDDDASESWQARIRTAQSLVRSAEYAKAETLLRELLNDMRRPTGYPGDAVAGAVWNNLGILYHDLGKLPEAERCYRQSIRLWHKAAGPESLGQASPLNSLGQLLRSVHRYREAEKVLHRALLIREKHHGPEHPTLAGTLNSLACLRLAAGKPAEAEPLFLRALRILDRAPHGMAEEAAAAHHNLGGLYQEQKRHQAAESHLRAAIAIWQKEFGVNHPAYALGLAGLADLHLAQGNLESAESLLQQAIVIVEQRLGSSHPRLGEILLVYSEVLHRRNRVAESKRLRKRAEAIQQLGRRENLRDHSIDASEFASPKSQ